MSRNAFAFMDLPPEHVMEHLKSLRGRKVKKRPIALEAGIAPGTLCRYVQTPSFATREAYNKVASVMGWEEWE